MESTLQSPLFKRTLKKYYTTFEDLFICKPIAHKCYHHLAIISLSLIYSISSKQVFIAISVFGAPPPSPPNKTKNKKQKLKPDTSVQFSSPHPGKGQIPTLGKALQIKFPTPRTQKVVKCLGFAREGGGC